MRSHNMNPRKNVNNNARRNEKVKGNQVENLNKTFVREGTVGILKHHGFKLPR